MEKLYDDLTGLYSFTGFQLRVEEHLKTCDKKHVIILFDIINFKMVNSIYGLVAGDRLLNEIGETFRTIDVPELMCCRLKGDIYGAFVLEEYSQILIDTILQKQYFAGDDDTNPVDINVAIYHITDKNMPVSMMCDRANMALSTIKSNHMEKVVVYDDDLYKTMVNEHELCNQLGPSLEQGQIKMYLQPQVNPNGQILGAESLVRWDHPTRGLLMPGAFLPLFERNYMIVRIDQYIWEQACIQLKQWEKSNKGHLYLSVNISPRDFECMNVYDTLTRLVRKYNINPKRLRIEITETTIMQNPYEQVKLIGRLRSAGFYVEMDDFGSGYSSFSMLKDIKIDAIKLDMRFLSATINEERGKMILTTIISLAKELKMAVIAEGVEKREDVEFLRSLGCDMFQGFYYACPVKLEEFEDMVTNNSLYQPQQAVS